MIDSPPWRSPLAEGARAVYVASAMVVSWLLAIVLAFASSPLYAPYAAEATRPGGISALTDQQLAAGVMWVPGSIPFTIAIIFIIYRWLEPERARDPAPRARALAETRDLGGNRMPLPSNIIAITVAGQGVLTWAIPLFVFLAVLAWCMMLLIRRYPE